MISKNFSWFPSRICLSKPICFKIYLYHFWFYKSLKVFFKLFLLLVFLLKFFKKFTFSVLFLFRKFTASVYSLKDFIVYFSMYFFAPLSGTILIIQWFFVFVFGKAVGLAVFSSLGREKARSYCSKFLSQRAVLQFGIVQCCFRASKAPLPRVRPNVGNCEGSFRLIPQRYWPSLLMSIVLALYSWSVLFRRWVC